MEILQYVYTHTILKDYFRSIADMDPSEGNNLNELRKLIRMENVDLKKIFDSI
jgi:hypothetical protein